MVRILKLHYLLLALFAIASGVVACGAFSSPRAFGDPLYRTIIPLALLAEIIFCACLIRGVFRSWNWWYGLILNISYCLLGLFLVYDGLAAVLEEKKALQRIKPPGIWFGFAVMGTCLLILGLILALVWWTPRIRSKFQAA